MTASNRLFLRFVLSAGEMRKISTFLRSLQCLEIRFLRLTAAA